MSVYTIESYPVVYSTVNSYIGLFRYLANVVTATTTVILNLPTQETPTVLRSYAVDPIDLAYINEHDVTHTAKQLVQILAATSTCTLWIELNNNLHANLLGRSIVDSDVMCKLLIKSFDLENLSIVAIDPWLVVVQIASVINSISSVVLGTFYRNRALESMLEAFSTYVWNEDRLHLIRRIQANLVAICIAQLLSSVMMRKGNPSIRIEPLKWYRLRLDAGKIVIPENEWL